MPYKKGGGRNCAVYNCRNNQRKLGLWRDEHCMIHVGFIHRQCPCKEPFRFCNIPQVTKSGDETRRLQWLKAIYRLNLPRTRGVVCSTHFVDGCPTIMNPLPTLNIEPPPKDKDIKKKSSNILKLASKQQHKSFMERNLFSKSQEEYQGQLQQQQQQQQRLTRLTETVKNALQRTPNKVLEQLQSVVESRNEKLLKQMLYQMNPQTQSKQISAALGKPISPERGRRSPLNTASTSHSTIEVENTSPPAKKAREIIDLDDSDEELTKPFLVKPQSSHSASAVHSSVVDTNVPQQKRILVVPNHQQSVMTNLSSLWKAGRLCDAFISNGTVNVKVHKMILGAVCPKVLDVFYNTPQHKLPKVTFPSSVSKEALLAFAEYMYNGILDLDPDLLVQMRVIAQRLDMKDFEQLCANQLESSLPPNMLPTMLEPMLSEPCSSSGLIQRMKPQHNQTTVMEMIPTLNRTLKKEVHTVDSLKSGSRISNTSNVSLSNLPLEEVGAETDDNLMEIVNNNFDFPAANDNNCDIDLSMLPPVKIEKIEPEDSQYGREVISSGIDYSTSDNIVTSNFPHFSNTDLSSQPSSSATTSTSQHTNHAYNKSSNVGHNSKQNITDKGNIDAVSNPSDPYPMNLFTSNWANMPLHTQEIKKEYNT